MYASDDGQNNILLILSEQQKKRTSNLHIYSQFSLRFFFSKKGEKTSEIKLKNTLPKFERDQKPSEPK